MTPYELQVLNEIGEWEKKGPGRLVWSLDILGAPMRLIAKSAPQSVQSAVRAAIAGFMEMLREVSYWSYSDKSILKEAKTQGIDARGITDLAGHDLQRLDLVARRFFSSNKVIAALEGAGCGLGGLALVAADIPVLLAIGFRSIQQIGASYGFDMRDPAMAPVVMGVISAGSGSSIAVKSSVLADMHVTAAALAGDAAFSGIAGRTGTGAVLDKLAGTAGVLPGRLADTITRRKLSQLIPIVGATIGAGFNYWFMGNIAVSACMVFRKLYLERKYRPAVAKPYGRLMMALRRLIRGNRVNRNAAEKGT
ncbi:MAG: EcsC family protein [Spirochaetes bacterium]|nr:EcsC family protein [Spirochaetota bacterium]